jgi:hypothetical protein
MMLARAIGRFVGPVDAVQMSVAHGALGEALAEIAGEKSGTFAVL